MKRYITLALCALTVFGLGSCNKVHEEDVDSAIRTVEQAIRYEAHDPDSLKSLYNSLFSDVPQLPPLTTGDLIPELDPMPVHLEDYDRFLKRGGGLNA